MASIKNDKFTIKFGAWSYVWGVFIALKVMGFHYSWWWLLMPGVPCIIELFHFIGKYVR